MAYNDRQPPGEGDQQSPASVAHSPAQDAAAIDNQPTEPHIAIVKPEVPAGYLSPTAPTEVTLKAGNPELNGQAAQPQATFPSPDGTNTGWRGTPVITVRNLTKTYFLGKTQVEALQGVSLEVYPGEFVAIMGPSGSGKSTFMNLLGCLDRPTRGEYWLAGKLVSGLSNDELADVRNQLIGFVFQGFNLLGRASALRNVALPMVYAGLSRQERERRARKVLQLVGLGDRVGHKPPELSGGQQQRVAIARALINGPSLLLADEPTGNLDSHTSVEIMGVLQALHALGLTIVLVTHDARIAEYAQRQVGFLDGRIVRDEPVRAPRSAQAEWTALLNAAPADGQPPPKEDSR